MWNQNYKVQAGNGLLKFYSLQSDNTTVDQLVHVVQLATLSMTLTAPEELQFLNEGGEAFVVPFGRVSALVDPKDNPLPYLGSFDALEAFIRRMERINVLGYPVLEAGMIEPGRVAIEEPDQTELLPVAVGYSAFRLNNPDLGEPVILIGLIRPSCTEQAAFYMGMEGTGFPDETGLNIDHLGLSGTYNPESRPVYAYNEEARGVTTRFFVLVRYDYVNEVWNVYRTFDEN